MVEESGERCFVADALGVRTVLLQMRLISVDQFISFFRLNAATCVDPGDAATSGRQLKQIGPEICVQRMKLYSLARHWLHASGTKDVGQQCGAVASPAGGFDRQVLRMRP
ncbi:hypothetical protein AK812_SmicGene3788 [Symbiodinium microadriaticum]|uniref:Uncharacterized protein n=1 Tax=Symbiodinium microadriaticum TaxID=2951 RepID=A0A1Q9EXY0_SYMMI|nr:hypothetical protein AK812_SmicGene3788 [Symbiodinium microadriaticum]CAE7892831.1 unnamed protein product [Symbiodinium sp. KB8]CAE7907732.1 unnamed protein product [Symbiodinium microadriaticum]